MPTTVSYQDQTFAAAARVAWIVALAGVLGFSLSMAEILDVSAVPFLVFAAVCALISLFYRSAVKVEVEVGPDGIRERQGLGLGWNLSWPSVTKLEHVTLGREPVLAVVSPELSNRRGLNDWRLRRTSLPRNARSVPATPEIVEAVRVHSGLTI